MSSAPGETIAGPDGRPVLRVGLGCMGMSFAYGRDEASDDAVQVLQAALDGAPPGAATLLDTADVYGPFVNEELVGTALAGQPADRALVATKGGLVATGAGNRTRPDGRPERLRAAVDGSLRRLGRERIDLYYLHRVDPDVPLAESWGALADLVTAGKLGALGLSEVRVEELATAHGVHPVAAVQSELSLVRRVQLDRVVPWCADHGAMFVAYAPLGRGWLTGRIDETTSLGEDDFRRRMPMFAADALRENQQLLTHVRAVAEDRGITLGQVALAWLLAQSPSIVAIPGTRRVSRLRENAAATSVRLTAGELELLSSAGVPTQPRYAAATAKE